MTELQCTSRIIYWNIKKHCNLPTQYNIYTFSMILIKNTHHPTQS